MGRNVVKNIILFLESIHSVEFLILGENKEAGNYIISICHFSMLTQFCYGKTQNINK